MKCPVCAAADTRVLDSREIHDGRAIRRRRNCRRCMFRFSTYEEMELLDIIVKKRDGHEEEYSREKLEGGILRSLEKLPTTPAKVNGLIHRIERDIAVKAKVVSREDAPPRREIESRIIGEIVMKALKRFDAVAYLRFASVYQSFQDLGAFQKALLELNIGKKQKVAAR
ncbi:transcriptional repressor NrdR [Candidatus Uhrbacteria bacterium]|nr:transcriptional repressor NrdR [Candidatus Uhrbacteria bacterium]